MSFLRKVFNVFLSTLLLLTLFINCLTDSKFKKVYAPRLCSDDVNTRKEAIEAINRLGPEAKVAENDLIKLFKKDREDEVRRLAIEALGAIKADVSTKEVNQVFVLAMNDECPFVRYSAIAVIEELEVIPVNLIPYLQKHLSDPDSLVRDVTMRSFQRMEKLGTQSLIGALKFPDMRRSAAITLGRLGKAGRLSGSDCKTVVEELKKIQESDINSEVKDAVDQALKAILGNESKE